MNVIATYYLEADDIKAAADALAGEQSTGTWVRVGFETDTLMERHRAKVLDVTGNIVRVAFPFENFGPVIPMLLTTTAGNLFEMGDFKNVKLMDLEFPKEFVKEFKGPKFGIEGTKRMLGVKGRPLIGCIVKPCVGLPPAEFAEACYQAAVGGVDFIKDDELIANPGYSQIEERTNKTAEALDRANAEKGEKTMYAVNVTDEVDRIMENADTAIENGANCLMLNFVTAGFSALRVLCEDESIKVPVHCHRDMFAAFTRSDVHGIHTQVVSKLARLCGGDQVHVGAVIGKLYEGIDSVMQSVKVLKEDFYDISPSLPVSSGGQHPGKIPENLKLLDEDALILAGGGIFGHTDGAMAGARAMRQALDATLSEISLEEYAKEHTELKAAIEQWGLP
ncbi:MAG: RuBisCO large subunit C-terminal-like domain-containing protein [Candidatus Hydrothermarchaeaceae archaeon]